MSLKVYVRLHQLFGLPKGSYDLRCFVRPLDAAGMGECHYSESTGALYSKTHAQTVATGRYGPILVVEIRTSVSPTTICAVSIPMNWLPSDQTVRDFFPFQSHVERRPGQYMGELEIHVMKRDRGTPFAAPRGTLLVLPAWPRPGKPVVVPAPAPVPPGYVRVMRPPMPTGPVAPEPVVRPKAPAMPPQQYYYAPARPQPSAPSPPPPQYAAPPPYAAPPQGYAPPKAHSPPPQAYAPPPPQYAPPPQYPPQYAPPPAQAYAPPPPVGDLPPYPPPQSAVFGPPPSAAQSVQYPAPQAPGEKPVPNPYADIGTGNYPSIPSYPEV